MNQQKGFSLTEVLVSLMLVATIALALFEQQLQTRQILNKIIVRTMAFRSFDKAAELWFAQTGQNKCRDGDLE